MSRAPPPESQQRRRPSQIRRVVVATGVTIAMSILGLVYFRIATPYFIPMARGNYQGLVSGPFSSTAGAIVVIVPVAIGVIVLAAWAWVVVGPIQQERTVRRR
jgi:hypothetical protein